MMENGFQALWHSMGIANLEWGQMLMILIGAGLIFLAIRKGFEPLLLLPIGFGVIVGNIEGSKTVVVQGMPYASRHHGAGQCNRPQRHQPFVELRRRSAM